MDVYIFGAGASAAEGVPATADFLSRAWELLGPDFPEPVRSVWAFLEAIYQVELTGSESFRFIPGVDEVISLVDWSLHVNQGLGYEYAPQRLHRVRHDLELVIGAALDAAVRGQDPSHGPHAIFAANLKTHFAPGGVALLSLNYDTLLDEALAAAGVPVNYGFGDIDLNSHAGLFLGKLHGSLNWALCSACDHVEVIPCGNSSAALEPSCARCGNVRLRRVIVSPTWLKRYNSSQLRHVWDLAFESVQRARRIHLVGYSMPPADIAIYQLIRRGLLARRSSSPVEFVVINHDQADWTAVERSSHRQAVAARFTRLFGEGIRFDFTGFCGQV